MSSNDRLFAFMEMAFGNRWEENDFNRDVVLPELMNLRTYVEMEAEREAEAKTCEKIGGELDAAGFIGWSTALRARAAALREGKP